MRLRQVDRFQRVGRRNLAGKYVRRIERWFGIAAAEPSERNNTRLDIQVERVPRFQLSQGVRPATAGHRRTSSDGRAADASNWEPVSHGHRSSDNMHHGNRRVKVRRSRSQRRGSVPEAVSQRD